MNDPMPPPNVGERKANPFQPYLYSVASVAVALSCGLVVERWLALTGSYSPYVLFAGAIMYSAVQGGFGAGLFATLLSGLATGFFHLHPLFSLRVENPGEAVVLGMFLLEGMILSSVAAALKRGDRSSPGGSNPYAVAVGAVALTVLAKLIFASLTPQAMPFMLFYGCVIFAAWYGGPASGMVATLVSALSVAFLFFEPRFDFRIDDPERAAQLVAFLLEGGLISLFSRTVEQTRRKARAKERQATDFWTELRGTERRLRRQNQALIDLARQRAESSDFDGFIRDLTKTTSTTMEAERVGVWVFDSPRKALVCIDLYERSKGTHSAGVKLRVEDYPHYIRAIEENRFLAASDARLDERTREFTASYLVPLDIQSMLDAPIRRGGSVTGVICIEQVGTLRVWTIDEEQFAGSIADCITLALKQQDLQTAEAKLLRAQRLESIGSLASGIAHDLNNLLTPVVMGTDLLRESTIGEEQLSLLDLIQSSAERGGTLIRQILAFARGPSSTAAQVQIEAVVAPVVNLLRQTLRNGIELVVELPPAIDAILGTASQLDQVIMNLCVNARDAMPVGGRLTIRVANRELAFGSTELQGDAKPGNYVSLAVADSGTGIAPEILHRIFDPFFSTKEPGRGTGLGLATTQAIVTGLGGFLNVESRLGQGTTFTVYLPAVGSVDVAKSDSHETPVGHGEFILVADENASIRELACRILEAYGYRCVTVADDIELLAQSRKYADELRVIVLDMTMPGQNLAYTCEALQGEFPNVSVLLTIGTASDPEPEDGLAKVHLLQKPYTKAQLLQKLHRILVPPTTEP